MVKGAPENSKPENFRSCSHWSEADGFPLLLEPQHHELRERDVLVENTLQISMNLVEMRGIFHITRILHEVIHDLYADI